MNVRERVIAGLRERAERLFERDDDGTGRSEAFLKALSVAEYELEFVGDFVLEWLRGNREMACELIGRMISGGGPAAFGDWGKSQLAETESVMIHVWKGRVSGAEWRYLTEWLGEVRRLIEDTDRLILSRTSGD